MVPLTSAQAIGHMTYVLPRGTPRFASYTYRKVTCILPEIHEKNKT